MILLIYSLFLTTMSYAQINDSFELQPIEVWTEQYNQSFQQVNPVNLISKEEIQQSNTADLNRLLKLQTGIQIQEEDAWGLRPNIGIRGTPPHRSRKVTFYEDSLLIGPAPYSAPASYYNPHLSRVENLDIYKGLSSILFGPNTVGGVINYITPRFTNKASQSVLIQYGNFNTLRTHLFASSNNSGPHKFLLSGDIFQTDGFKQLDGGGNTGFKKYDFLAKYSYQLSSLPAELSLKFGFANEDSNETYLGLTIDDYNESPLRRYRASASDNMAFRHLQGQVGFSYFPRSGWQSNTQLYRHGFKRNWKRVNNLSGTSNLPSITDVLKSPTGANLNYLELLRGEIDSSSFGVGNSVFISRANNDRYFISQGVQNMLTSPLYTLDQGSIKFKGLARLHQDQIERRHTFTDLEMTQGNLVERAVYNGVQNLDQSQATTVGAEAEYQLGIVTSLVSARAESVSYRAHDFASQSIRTRQDQVFVPGAGVLVSLGNHWALFSSLNQAVTLVGPRGGETEIPELANNFELGARFFHPDYGLFFESLVFQTDYQNIQGVCSFSSGCLNDANLDSAFKGGRALIQGIELKAHSQVEYKAYRIPFELNATLLSAQFKDRFDSTNPEWGVGTLNPGDPLPYAPELIFSVNIGLEKGSWSHRLVTQHTGLQYDQSVDTDRFIVPAFTVFDFFSNYKLNENESINFRADNLLGTQYVVSFRPFGARPGKPQSFQLSYRYTF